MQVHIVVNDIPGERDRILPRMFRLLAEGTGWSIGAKPNPKADVQYAAPYLEARRWPDGLRFAGYFTHREDILPAKVDIWRKQAERAALRITSAQQYAPELAEYGPTVVTPPPLDRDLFSPSRIRQRRVDESRPVAGVSGFSYSGGRKGEALLAQVLKERIADSFEWSAIGRGWPIKTRRISNEELPDWYASLDLYVCPSLIEGIGYGVLEALACGVPVVIPRGVGLFDELPDMLGIFRYERGDVASFCEALTCAEAELQHDRCIDRDALRTTTERFTEEAWINGHMEAFASLESGENGGIFPPPPAAPVPPLSRADHGIFVVAYGAPARACAEKLIASVRQYMPGVAVAVASETPLEAADVSVCAPDADLGGRTAKTKMYDTAPAEWERVLYLDADIELTADVSFLFDVLTSGWEMVCTHDIDDPDPAKSYDLIWSLFRRDTQERTLGMEALGSDRALQLAGGVVGFRRTEATRAFFAAWYEEWHRLARRDQGAMIRAMYAHPVRLLVLGNEWNSFEGLFTRESAGVLHHRGGPARRLHRWSGGRLDDPDILMVSRNGNFRMGVKPSQAERAAALREAVANGATQVGGNRYRMGDSMKQCPTCTTNNGACAEHSLPPGLVLSGEVPHQRPIHILQRASTGVAGVKGDVEVIEPSEAKARHGATGNKKRKTTAGNKA